MEEALGEEGDGQRGEAGRYPCEGMDGLMQAARDGRWMEVEVLVGSCDPLAADEDGFTALMRASRAGCGRSVSILLPVSDPFAKNKAGSTALIEAAKWGTATCCALLAARVGTKGRSPNGKSAIDCALARWALPEALALARAAGSVGADRRGVNELMRASEMLGEASAVAAEEDGEGLAGKAPSVRCMLVSLVAELGSKPGADSVDAKGRDALMRAAWAGKTEVAKALLPWLSSGRIDELGLDAAGLARSAGHGELGALIEGFDSKRDAAQKKGFADIIRRG